MQLSVNCFLACFNCLLFSGSETSEVACNSCNVILLGSKHGANMLFFYLGLNQLSCSWYCTKYYLK